MPNLNDTPFSFDPFDNILVVEGCGSAAIINKDGTTHGECLATCGNDTFSNNSFGIGSCHSMIRQGLGQRFTFNLSGLKRQVNGTCGSAFVIAADSYVKGGLYGQLVPVKLGLDSGLRVYNDCLSCRRSGGSCHYRRASAPIFEVFSCRYDRSKKKPLGVILGISISTGLLFLSVIIYILYNFIKKRNAEIRKKMFFKRNGGLLLQKQEAAKIVDHHTIHFSSTELEKATDHYNDNRVLGEGGQGKVYKGMLDDGKIVAIKKANIVVGNMEVQAAEFINEVVILSQVNHRNIVKLLGCCLDTEVPLLVSEFIPNGTLYDRIHDETSDIPFSLDRRLQIATEVAGAISYLHSATSIPIYHRDIKSKNILLDESYTAKVSDFGISRFVSEDKTHLTTKVGGTVGYIALDTFADGRYTEKTDVYSFGVVVLELLTREKPVCLAKFGDSGNLVTYFKTAMEKDELMSIVDAKVVGEGSETTFLAVANLAIRCLDSIGTNRPRMNEVCIALEGIRLSHTGV